MTNKTKKRNRKRYFIKQSRKMNGGDTNSLEYKIPPPPPPIKNKDTVITPTLQENLSNAGEVISDFGNTVAAAGIKSIDNVKNEVLEDLGVDATGTVEEQVKEGINNLGNIFENVNKELDTPEGKKLQENIGELASDAVNILKNPANKAAEIAGEGLEKLSESGAKAVVTAANVFPPINALNEVSILVKAGEEAATTAAKLTTVGADALDKLGKKKEEALSVFNTASNMVNRAIQQGINTAKSGVDSLKNNVIKNSLKANISKANNPKMNTIQSGGRLLKNYNKTAKLIGGRVLASQLEFLSPYVNSSHKIQSRGGNWKTRHRHKLTSNRCR